ANTPDVLTEATADLAMALLLAAARRVVEGDRLVREGWDGWSLDLLLGKELAGATMGSIGLGRIGRAVARRARGSGLELLYRGRRDVPEAAALGARRAPLDALLAASDVVALHCPLTPATPLLIGARALAR